jgi:hypothetical protein
MTVVTANFVKVCTNFTKKGCLFGKQVRNQRWILCDYSTMSMHINAQRIAFAAVSEWQDV